MKRTEIGRTGPKIGNQKRTDTMNKKQSIMLAMTAALLASGSQAHAQLNYSADDLLLNFRDTDTISGNDLEVNLGLISTFAAFQGTEIVAPAGLVTGAFGAPSASVPIGLSAFAADAPGATGTLWLTRVDLTPGLTPSPVSAQQEFSVQNLVAARINNIGLGGNGGTADGSGAALVAGGTSGNSYQAQGEQSTAVGASGQMTINFGGDENIAASKGGPIESIQNGSAPVYESLWEMPVTGTADTYLGYFTFSPNGQVDFTSASTVPEPCTCALLAATGLIGWALRRQIRSLIT
jgi:hypothetical protein